MPKAPDQGEEKKETKEVNNDTPKKSPAAQGKTVAAGALVFFEQGDYSQPAARRL